MKAKEIFTVEEFQCSMLGVYSITINKYSLDEFLMAYNDMSDIVNNIEATAEIIEIIKLLFNFKAGE